VRITGDIIALLPVMPPWPSMSRTAHKIEMEGGLFAAYPVEAAERSCSGEQDDYSEPQRHSCGPATTTWRGCKGGPLAHFFCFWDQDFASLMALEDRITALIAPTVTDLGYELVRIQMQGRQRPTLQIMAERTDRFPMSVEDCERISHAVSAILDVEDPVAGAYTLEVSSPGIDRPLTRAQDFIRFAGFEARIDTLLLVEGRKRFRGRIDGLDGTDQVLVTLEDGAQIAIPRTDIAKAKLILTDALIDAALAEQTAAMEAAGIAVEGGDVDDIALETEIDFDIDGDDDGDEDGDTEFSAANDDDPVDEDETPRNTDPTH